MAYTESRTITGKVTDQSGQPLAGVTSSCSKVKPQGQSLIIMGITVLPLTISQKFCIFTFLGYTKVEEKIGDRSIINVIMKEEAVVLNEMVVTALRYKKGE